MFKGEHVKLALPSVILGAAWVLFVADGRSIETADASPTEAGVGQANAPAVEYQSLLNMCYYEPDGGFLVDDLQMVFPPQGNQKLTFVLTRKTGEEVARVPLRIERLRTFEAFRVLRPDGVPGVVRIGQSGDFVMAVKAGDQAITTLPFTLKVEKSSDPYNPKKTYVREGPWRELAYFSSPIYEDGKLTIAIKVNGQPFKSYRAQIRGGQPVRLARNQMEVEPHTDFISTRLVDVSRDGGCEYCMLDLIWVTRIAR